MNTIKALVLTFDRYRNITENMICAYEALWPDNPFVFRVPYQKYPKDLKEKYGRKIELIHTEKDIISTFTALLADLDDEEWVYWCMDDRYPLYLNTKELSDIHRWLTTVAPSDVAGVGFSSNSQDWNPENIMSVENDIRDDKGRRYSRITNYKIIWFHQFMRVKILRELVRQFPKNIKNAKEMEPYKNKAILPEDYKRYLYTKRLAFFGESTTRGMLTQNCVSSMRKYGIPVPTNLEVINKKLFRGIRWREKMLIRLGFL